MLTAHLIASAQSASLSARASGTTRAWGGGGTCGAEARGGDGSARSGKDPGDGPVAGGSGGGDASRSEELQKLSKVVTDGAGARWRTDWSAAERAAFQEGIYAFRRNFERIRRKYLPHRTYQELVEYFYRWVPWRGGGSPMVWLPLTT